MPWQARSSGDDGPTALALTRQALPHQPRTARADCGHQARRLHVDRLRGTPECIVIATGSEVGIAAEAVSRAREARPSRAPGVDALLRDLRRAPDAAYRGASAAGGGSYASLSRGRRQRDLVPATWATRVVSSAWIISGLRARRPTCSKHFGFTAGHVLETVEDALTHAEVVVNAERARPWRSR